MVLKRNLLVAFISMLSLDAVAQVSEVKSAAKKEVVSPKLKKGSVKKAPVVNTPVVEAPVVETPVVPEPTAAPAGSAGAGLNYLFVDLGYSKPLGPVKNYVKGAFQYGFEYVRTLPVFPECRMMIRAGLLYNRSLHTGKLNGGSTAKSLRQDTLFVAGATTSGDGIRFFGDGLLGLSSRRLYIKSGSESVGDDYYSRTKVGVGIRGGVEYLFAIAGNHAVARAGVGFLGGPAMTSGHLHYDQKRVNIGGWGMNLGMNLGWQF